MPKFSFTRFSTPRLSRKAVLGIAAALAVTGATGAAALLAPANINNFLPSVSAQTLTTPTPDIMSQEPFDRLVQSAPAPDAAQQPLPTTTAFAPPSTQASPPAQDVRPNNRFVRRASSPAPTQSPAAPQTQAFDTPVAQAPAGAPQNGEPQGQMIPTAGPGLVPTSKRVAQTPIVTPVKQIVRTRAVHVHTPYCND